MKNNRNSRREETFWRELMENWMDVNHLHRTILERKLNQNGLYRSQHQLLMYISDHPNQSQKEIARLNRISPATAAVTLKKLEKGGYIHRVADDRDNRCNQICLTEKGKLVVEYSIRYFSQVQQRMFAGFTEEERIRLTGDLERIKKNLTEFLSETEREDIS